MHDNNLFSAGAQPEPYNTCCTSISIFCDFRGEFEIAKLRQNVGLVHNQTYRPHITIATLKLKHVVVNSTITNQQKLQMVKKLINN